MSLETSGGTTPYQVLARKYRPQSLSELIGQEPMVQTLTNAFAAGRIAHAYLLTGVRGVGKTSTARILARALNYQQRGGPDRPSVDFTEVGEHCLAIMEGRHIDVIEMDAASHTGIGDIREIIEAVRYKPSVARYKVYIIDEVHMLSNQAFNGLLKTLEEPPEHVKFIFATTEIRKVPVTILSRCQRFDLRRIGADKLAALLKEVASKEKISIDDDALAIVARSGEGSARDSLSLLDQAIAVGPEHGQSHRSVSAEDIRSMLGLAERNRVIDLFDQLMQGNAAKALAILGDLYDAGADPTAVLEDIANFNHIVTRLKVTPAAADDAALTEEERDRGKTMADAISVRALSRSWQILLKGIDESRGAARPLAAAEMVLVRLAHVADLPTPDEAIAAVQRGPATGASRPASSMPADASSAAFNKTSDRPSRAAAFAEPTPASDPAPVVDSQEDSAPQLRGLEDLVALAAEKRDLQLKFALERFVRPVRLDSNRIEIGLTSDAPKTFTSDLGARLLEWTGQRWVISIAGDATALTVHEKRTAAREQLESDTRSNPTVAAVMARFPGAEIVDIRVKAVETNIVAGPDQLTAEESENS